MKIDITREPQPDLFRHHGKYIRIFIALLTLAGCAVLLGVYAIVSDTPQSMGLETVVLALFVGPALAIYYIGEKLQAYKKLTPDQEKELADLARKHPEIKIYCELVAKAGRQPIQAECEACQTWSEETGRQPKPKNS
ncbi:MAG: hypothetical protein A2521_16800 [Deltaproteobacteria bacterium RIFOXYD12_FULL_57_12]|nr:MAG: hypothetical protein A2521_16800 [Deltaproteobacteria bacterium RIFOXYD12_FULL_57_12]